MLISAGFGRLPAAICTSNSGPTASAARFDFSPLPPARSGIADYSQALLEPLGRLAEAKAETGQK